MAGKERALSEGGGLAEPAKKKKAGEKTYARVGWGIQKK